MIHIKAPTLQLKKRLTWLRPPKRLLSLLLVLVFFLIFLPIELSLVYNFVFKDKIFPNIFVLSYNLSAQTSFQSQTQLQTILKHNPPAISLKHEQTTWQVDPQSLRTRYDLAGTARRAYQIGRDQSWWENQINRWRLFYQPQALPFSVSFDHSSWETAMATISAQISQPAISPTIKIEGLGQSRSVTVNSGQSGEEVDLIQLTQTLRHQLAHLDFQPITLPLVPIQPSVTQAQAETTKERAEKLVNKSLSLSTPEQAWILKDEELINFLDFTDGFDEEKIASWTAQLTKSIDRPPQNALDVDQPVLVGNADPLLEPMMDIRS